MKATTWPPCSRCTIRAPTMDATKPTCWLSATSSSRRWTATRSGGRRSRPAGRVNRHEQQRNLDLVLREFRNYQQGIMPAGAQALARLAAQHDEITHLRSAAPPPAGSHGFPTRLPPSDPAADMATTPHGHGMP